jgi:hypothetical protein
MKPSATAAGCLALALLTFFQFPGHTWLQQDSQIYVPILEHLRDASALRNELLATKPHVAYTLYDETALALRAATRLDFRYVLAAEQIAARAFGIWGLYLLALALLGRARPGWAALFVAAVCSLGAVIAGPTVLTVEYEPTPRAFALPLVVCAVGLAVGRRFIGAGVAGAAAFLFHPPSALPFWALYGVVAMLPASRKSGRPWWFVPLAAATVILLLFARRQEASGEAQSFLARLTPELERLQRFRASYNWISTWPAAVIAHYAILFALLLAAFARLRREMGPELRVFALGLPALGMLSMPVSWLLLEHSRWALIPQFQPMRCLLFVTLFVQVLAACAGLRASTQGRAVEAIAWFAAAFLPVLQPVVTEAWSIRATAVLVGLAVLSWAAARLRPATALPLAVALAAYFAIPGLAGVVNYPRWHTPELQQLSEWASSSTPRDAVFLFPDARKEGYPGIFRCEAIRAVYVDWKSGGQVNYLPGFARQWWFRWQQTMANRFKPSDVPKYEALGIRYIVLKSPNRLPQPAVFQNATFAAYDLGSPAPSPRPLAPTP